MVSKHEASRRVLQEKADGLGEQLASICIQDLTQKHDRGVVSPQVEVIAPLSLTHAIYDETDGDDQLREQFASMIFDSAKDRIKAMLRCEDADIYPTNVSSKMQRNHRLRLTVRAID